MRRRLKEYRGAGGLLALPGEPAPNGPDHKSVTARRWGDFAPPVKVLAKALHEGWWAESGEQRRFIGGYRQAWDAMREDDRVLYCAQAEAALTLLARWQSLSPEDQSLLIAEADRWG